MSGVSTPLSPLSSLSTSNPAYFIHENVFLNPRIPASNLIEWISSRKSSSSAVYIYDIAEQAGFGKLTKQLSASYENTAPVVDFQTRPGAGLNIVGRLSELTSQDALKDSTLSVYTTPSGLAAMAPLFPYLPAARPKNRLVIQVPAITWADGAHALSPSLAHLSTTLAFLPKDAAILLSATPQESVDFASLSYRLVNNHVVHIFDYYTQNREIGHRITPLSEDASKFGSIKDIVTQAGYSLFEYIGDPEARSAIVILNSSLALYAKELIRQVSNFGMLVVKMLRPWDEAAFRESVPASVTTLHVLDETFAASTGGALSADVLGSLGHQSSPISIHPHPIFPSQLSLYLTDPHEFIRFLSRFHPKSPSLSIYNTTDIKRLLVFSTPNSVLSAFPQVVENLFLQSFHIAVRMLTDFDMLSRAGGVRSDRIILTPRGGLLSQAPVEMLLPLAVNSTGDSDFLAVFDHTLLKSHSVLKFAAAGAVVLVTSPWAPAEFSSNLPDDVITIALSRKLRFFVIDTKGLSSMVGEGNGASVDAIQSMLIYLVFLRLYLGNATSETVILKTVRRSFEGLLDTAQLARVNSLAWSGLAEVTIQSPQTDAVEKQRPSLKEFSVNTIAVASETEESSMAGPRLGIWHDGAKHLIFSSVYTPSSVPTIDEFSQDPTLRPEITDRTYLVTCTVNRRMTPKEYDRNVFHLEFDTTGTGLKYAIGEALGVHGWNDEGDVLEFCKWYGVNPDFLITIPVPEGEGNMHTRTVFQALQQQIDLFGQPPKSFYTDLAPYATSLVDKHALQFIGSAEGSVTFKKLAEKDTVHFVDILKLYPSARPGIETLCELIGDIKPRHYSIASSQAVVGNRIDLLVVSVDWVTPCGSPRYGQCTRYLANLRVGQKVTVSIKPSVMKLPPDNKQPLIMAGLGTGAAPFRSFLQHRAWLAQQGHEVGPTYYYYGSRHQSQEYLYGEEIEAYILDGTITHAGLAFSRDGPKKVYIQHKMREDAEVLVKMLHDENGVFYLCGPTWPVPDVYNVLVEALATYQSLTPEAAGAYLETLKEEERYVLEVY